MVSMVLRTLLMFLLILILWVVIAYDPKAEVKQKPRKPKPVSERDMFGHLIADFMCTECHIPCYMNVGSMDCTGEGMFTYSYSFNLENKTDMLRLTRIKPILEAQFHCRMKIVKTPKSLFGDFKIYVNQWDYALSDTFYGVGK